MIYNATRDHGFGNFIHNNGDTPTGPDGPTISSGDRTIRPTPTATPTRLT